MAQTNQLMPGEWEAAGRGTSWGLGDGIFTQEAAKTKEAQYLADAVAMGNMDPRAAEGYYQGKLTRSIGNAANKLFGGKVNDPTLQEANDLDAVFRSLTEEDIKDPAVALNKVADHLAALGQTQKSIEFRLKAAQVFETTSAAKYQQEDRDNKIRIGKASDLGRAAKGALDGLFKANEAGSEAVATGIKDGFLKVYARINGQEEADKLKSLPNDQFMAMLDQTYESSKTIAQQGTEDLNAAKEKNRLEFQDRANKFKAGENQIKATATLIENNRKYTLNREKFDFRRDTVFATQVNKQIDDSQTQVKNLDSKIKDVENDLNELPTKPRYYGDISAEGYAAEKARLTAQRDTLVSQRNDLQATGDSLRSKYATFIEGTRTGDTGAPGATPPASSKATPNQGSQLEDWKQAKAAADVAMSRGMVDTANKIWNDYKTEWKITPSANTGTSAANNQPSGAKPNEVTQTPAVTSERKATFEDAFLAKLNQESDYEKVASAGKAILKPLQDFWVKYENDVKAQGELIDAFAKHAKAKLNDKAYVSRLSPNAKAKLEELANDSSIKSMERQQEGTQTMLTLAGTALTAGISTVTIKGLLKMSAAKAAKNAYKTRTPLKIETKMKALPEKVKISQEKVDRAAGLRERNDPALRLDVYGGPIPYQKPLFQ